MLKKIRVTPSINRKAVNATHEILGIHEAGKLVDSQYVVAAGIGRLLKHLDSKEDFAVISGFRPNYSFSQNLSRNNSLLKGLKSVLKNEKVGAFRLIGHWMGCTVELQPGDTLKNCKERGGDMKDNLEYSWLIPLPKEIQTDAFHKAIMNAASEYEQDAFLFRTANKMTVQSKSGEVWDTLGSNDAKSLEDALQNLALLRDSNQPFGYTELASMRKKGRLQPLVFMPYSISTPGNNSARMAAHYTGLLFIS